MGHGKRVDKNMEKMLITGAGGMLGRSLLRQLRGNEKYDIYAITTKYEKLAGYEYVNIVVCNLLDEEQCNKMFQNIEPDILVHLAWNQESSNFRQSCENLNWLNVSTRLLYLFEKYGGSKFIFAGSSSEYDGAEGIFKETDDVVPASIYGLCKKTFNEFANEYCKKRNLAYVGMRIFTIYGEEDRHEFGAIPYAITKLSEGEPVTCNNPATTRDYIYADDAASIALKLIAGTFTGIINVASGTPKDMAEVFNTIGKIMGKEDKVRLNLENKIKSRFEADISLLKTLELSETRDFYEGIRSVIACRQKEDKN